MRASWHGKSLLGNIGFALFFITLAFTLLIAAMNTSEAQEDLAALNQQVMQLENAGRKAEAIALAEKTVNLSRAQLGADHKTTGILLSQLGYLYRESYRFADAENALKAAVAILERGSGPIRFGAGDQQSRRRLSQSGTVFRSRKSVQARTCALRQAAGRQATQHHARQRHQQSRRAVRQPGQYAGRKRQGRRSQRRL